MYSKNCKENKIEAYVIKFVSQVDIDKNKTFSAEVFAKEGPGSQPSVFDSDRKYWSQEMKTALGLTGVPGFPYQLSPRKSKTPLPIPAVYFTEAAPYLAKIFNNEVRIYVTPDDFFVTKFREIFR